MQQINQRATDGAVDVPPAPADDGLKPMRVVTARQLAVDELHTHAADIPHPSRSAPKCINCTHFKPLKAGENRSAYCNHPAQPVALEDGLPTVPCEFARRDVTRCQRYGWQHCGPEAALFSAAQR